LLCVLISSRAAPLRAQSCASAGGLSPCFDANSLWLPAGKADFMTLPNTAVNAPGRFELGVATELLHNPVLAHVASPDGAGRDVQVVDFAFDASLLFAIGVARDLELSAVLPARILQSGAGAGGLNSQTAPAVESSALRDPRLGVAYSFDRLLGRRDLGLRAAFDASLPFGDQAAFAGDRTVVVMPTVTFGAQLTRVALRASAGARLRGGVEFGDAHLGSEGYVALGLGIDALAPGLLFFGLEGYALPPLSSSRAASANSNLSSVTLIPAEWLLSVRSSFQRDSDWSLSASIGTALPLSSETLRAAAGGGTTYFAGVTTPEWRTVLAVRFAPQ
jgi:hypothetical protein